MSADWLARILTMLLCGAAVQAHDIITTPVTWSHEISRIVYARCVSCHRPGGTAFSLLTYKDARSWAVAIREVTLERQMPPWGAVKGFGDFRNDQALTPEQLELIVSWTEGGLPQGDETDLPPLPKFEVVPAQKKARGEVVASGEMRLTKAFTLDGLLPVKLPPNTSFQITAEMPDGRIEPLLWLQNYKSAFEHAFLLRRPLLLPLGTLIHGIPSGARIRLLPAQPTR